MKKFRHKIYWFLNIFFAFLLLLSSFSYLIDPVNFWPAAFLSFSYPVWLFMNVLCIIWWLLRRKRKFWLSILVIAMGYQSLFNFFAFPVFNGSAFKSEKEKIKVMSWNVRLFDLYNWSNNNETKSKMFRFLEEEKPDIICFQEFFHQNRKNSLFVTRDSLFKILGAKYLHEEYTHKIIADQYFGSATYSIYPIVNKGKIEFNDAPSNICLFSDVKIKEDTFRIYNLHLASIRLSNEDHHFLENISDEDQQKKFKEGSGKIFSRMKRAFIVRSKQVKEIKKSMMSSPHPVIVMGDFNDTPTSFVYNNLKGDLVDAHKLHKYGVGGTYNGFANLFRIDYMLLNKEIKVEDFSVHQLPYSDHYALSAIIAR